MKSKLTPQQIEMIGRLYKADEIHHGIIWWCNKTWKHPIDGRVCNALVRKSILKPVDGNPTLHVLDLSGMPGYE